MASFTTDSNHRVLRIAFIDQGKFEAMKSLSGWEAACSDKHQFHAKFKVSTLVVFGTFATVPFVFSCLPRGFWATIRVLLITKALKRASLGA